MLATVMCQRGDIAMFSPELTKLHGKELASDLSFCALQNIKIP